MSDAPSDDHSLFGDVFPLAKGERVTGRHHNVVADGLDQIARSLGLESAGLPRLKDDEDFLGEHYNAIADKMALFDILRGPQHVCVKLGESDGQGRYAWREQIAQPGGAWSEEGSRSGSLERWPAVELNGNSGIKEGTIVLATVSIGCETLLFQIEGSPS